MPIVTVELVVESGRAVEPTLAQSVADAVGRAFDSPPGQTWVRLHTLQLNEYAENERSVGTEDLPVFVTVLKRQLPIGAQLRAEVTALTEAIAQVVGRPAACVHVEYAPSAVNRLSFGGTLVQ